MVSGPGKSAITPLHARTLFTSRRESEVAALLEELASRAPGVAVGFRPRLHEGSVWAKIVLESSDEGELEAASGWLAERLPKQPGV